MRGRYRDRTDAGRVLAGAVAERRAAERETRGSDTTDAAPHIVLALPRGGVPVAVPVAHELNAPLDVVVVRKVGVPWQPEVAMGAIASVGGAIVTVRNDDVLRHVADAERAFDEIAARERRELERREAAYRGGRGALEVAGRTVLLVDDGVATGATMRAAVEAVRSAGPARLVVAVPIGADDTLRELELLADDVVCPWVPDAFWAVGQGYVDFTQTTDDEVRELLAETSAGDQPEDASQN